MDQPRTAAPTRERILAAAATTLSVRGYSMTHLSDIARLAGLQPPAVYYHFDSREALVAEVMREGQRRVRRHVEEALGAVPETDGVIAKVLAAVDAHLRMELDLSDFARAVTRNAGQLPAHLRDALQEESSAYHDLWKQLLLRARQDQVLRPDIDPALGRMLVIGALNWATEWWTPAIPVDDAVSQAQSLVRAGLFTSAWHSEW